jgi:hypothetical protein
MTAAGHSLPERFQTPQSTHTNFRTHEAAGAAPAPTTDPDRDLGADGELGPGAGRGGRFLLDLVRPVTPDELVSLLSQCEESRVPKV